MKKRISILLALMLMCTAFLASCGGEGGNASGGTSSLPAEMTYKVTVKDNLGNAYPSGIVIQFMQNGEKKAMQACNEEGVAEKTLATGDYIVELGFTDDKNGYYYTGDLELSASKTELEVILARKITSEPETLYVGADEFDSYAVNTGCTYVDLTSGARNYYLFTPTVAGNYEFSVANAKDVKIGYYGAPHFVQSNNVAGNGDDKSFTISVSASMIGDGSSGTSMYVLGLDASDEDNNCVLCIERIGDPIKTIEDEPWEIYKTTSDLVEYSLPEGVEIKEFDLTASTDTYNLVYNEDDGFYHLGSADGALVMVRLAEDCDYIACFQTILDRSGVSRYFYDENGEFVKKVSYSECLLEYIKYVDENEGVYPLTEDLKTIIQNRGEYVGWWNNTSSGYLFKDENGNNDLSINTEIAWLLMCCYIE